MTSSHRNNSRETLSGRPDIVRFGNVMDAIHLRFLQRAADELNLTLERPKYRLVLDAESDFNYDGRRLPENWQRVRLLGPLEDSEIEELFERAGEIKTEYKPGRSIDEPPRQ